MWTGRHVTAWILLVSASSSTAPEAPAAPAAPAASPFAFPTNFEDIFNWATDVAGHFTNLFTHSDDKVTAGAIESFYKLPLQTLQEEEWKSCFHPLRLGNDLDITSMKLNFDRMKLSVKVEPEEISFSEPGFIDAPVKFIFPENSGVTASFKYYDHKTFGHARMGTADFVFPPVSVTVKAKFPMTKTAVKEVPDKKECQYRMSPEEIVVQEISDVRIENAKYNSRNKQNPNGALPAIIEALNQIKSEVISSVRADLGVHVVKVAKRRVFTCLDDDTEELWDKTEKECKLEKPDVEEAR